MGRARRLRYRHLRRTIIAVLATIAAVLLFALIGRMLLTAGPTRRLARNWIETVARQQEVSLEIQDLSWGFLPPQVKLTGVHLEGRGISAEVDTAEVDLARLRLTKQTVELGTVAADGVRLSLDNPPTRLRAREQRVKFRVRHLQLTRLEFEGTNLPGKIDLTVKGMDAGWTSDDGVPTGFARIDEVDLRAPGINPIKVALAARLLINDGLQIPSWTVTADGIDLHGTGRLAGSDGTSFTAAGSVDLESLDHIVRAGGILDGDIDVEATFDLAADEFVRAEIEGRHLSAAGFPLDDVAGRLILTTDGLTGHLDRAVAASDPEPLFAKGRVDLQRHC